MMRRVCCTATPLCRSFADTVAWAGPKPPPSNPQALSPRDLAAKLDMNPKGSEAGSLSIAVEEAKAHLAPVNACDSDYQPLHLPFAIDTATLPPNVRLEGPHTAVMTIWDVATVRASQPLSAANHRWAVKIHESGSGLSVGLGLLPKLPREREAEMRRRSITNLDGWCIWQNGFANFADGDWECEPLPFGRGDLVLFDYNFSDKTLTILCGDKEAVGHIPNAGEELYPAFFFEFVNTRISFEKYPT